MDHSIFHIENDIDCHVLKFGKELCIAIAGEDSVINLCKGRHKLTFVSTENEKDSCSIIYEVSENGIEDFIDVELVPVRDARLGKELKLHAPFDGQQSLFTIDLPENNVNLHMPEIIPCKYEDIKILNDNRYWTMINGKWGLIDEKDNILTPHIYDDICIRRRNGFTEVVYNKKYGVVDRDGQEVIKCIYDSIPYFSAEYNERVYAYLNDKSDIYLFLEDESGTKVYRKQSEFMDGYATIYHEGKQGIITPERKIVFPCIYDGIRYIGEGIFVITTCYYDEYAYDGQASKCMCVDIHGNSILEDKLGESGIYSNIGYFRNGIAPVWKYHHYGENIDIGFIDKYGNEVVQCVYGRLGNFHDGLAAVARNGKLGYINKDAQEVIPCIYDLPDDEHEFDTIKFHGNLIELRKNGKIGFVTKTGKEVSSFKYDLLWTEQHRFIRVQVGYKVGLFFKAGSRSREFIPCEYNNVYWVGGGLFAVVENKKWGYIDTRSAQVVPYIYDEIGFVHNSLARVRREDKWGYVNTKGVEIIPCNFDYAGDFRDGYAGVCKDGRGYLIDTSGKMVCKDYESAHLIKPNLIAVRNNEKWGCLNLKQEVVIPCMYEKISDRNSDEEYMWEYMTVELNGKKGYIDSNGKEIVPCIYDTINRVGNMVIVKKSGLFGLLRIC